MSSKRNLPSADKSCSVLSVEIWTKDAEEFETPVFVNGTLIPMGLEIDVRALPEGTKLGYKVVVEFVSEACMEFFGEKPVIMKRVEIIQRFLTSSTYPVMVYRLIGMVTRKGAKDMFGQSISNYEPSVRNVKGCPTRLSYGKNSSLSVPDTTAKNVVAGALAGARALVGADTNEKLISKAGSLIKELVLNSASSLPTTLSS